MDQIMESDERGEDTPLTRGLITEILLNISRTRGEIVGKIVMALRPECFS